MGLKIKLLALRCMKAPHSFILANQQLWLTPLRAIYWENERALIVSDLHFGKTGHFRKSGIGVPQDVYKHDLQRLFSLVQYFKPEELIIVGDFFHSGYNKENEWFARWRHDHAHLKCTLIMGNHDILHQRWYGEQDINVIYDVYRKGPFGFTHEWSENLLNDTKTYFFTGHLHPGVRMAGAGKQTLRLPCFYFGKQMAILPAFSTFTGLALVTPEKSANVFVIADQQLIHIR